MSSASTVVEATKDLWRPGFHLAPRSGWLNDPNGLCQFRGVYHAFFQYSPKWPDAGEKGWGHFVSKNLMDWAWAGIAIHQDIPEDASGAYSGSTLVEDNKMYLYYTGNVKEPGEHDFITSGRQANEILIRSDDGESFPHKHVLLRNADYPAECSCHVRDPKVWKQDGTFYMLLGARDLDAHGFILCYESPDGLEWKLRSTIRPIEPFGYMWECPDRIALGGREVLSCSPQGLPCELLRWQNLHQAGYFILKRGQRVIDVTSVDEVRFVEWDHGFDFYAPQTFVDESGRTILIAWMGIPDAPYGSAPEGLHWIHCFSVPRELSLSADGTRVLQWPVREVDEKRVLPVPAQLGAPISVPEHRADIVIDGVTSDEGEVILDDKLVFSYGGSRACLEFLDPPEQKIEVTGMVAEATAAASGDSSFGLGIGMGGQDLGGVGLGRDKRKIVLEEVRNIRILVDSSTVEIFVNDGEEVFSTRFFPREEELTITANVSAQIFNVWRMGA